MVTVVCSSQNQLDEFKEHVIKTSGLHNKLEFLGYENKGEFSLTEIYNRGLREAKNNIVVFMHDDIIIEKNKWAEKIIKLFDKNPDYGVIGVAGTKYLSSSGRWWEDPKKMYGKVSHTHEGKTWLSSYSEDLGNELEEVVLVDGVFFAVNKDKLKNNFNEDVKGFHFYDVNFCVENYLSGVKIGVTTLVRINHMSIGMTNDKWEENRQNFSDKFKENLPLTIKKVFTKNRPAKVLISSLNIVYDSVEQKHIFNLIKKLKTDNCDITIASVLDKKSEILVKQMGIKIFTLQEPPGFKLGDGKWLLKTQNGEVPSSLNTLYKIKDVDFDFLYLDKKPLIEHITRLYPNTEAICTIFDSNNPLDEPVINDSIKKYVVINGEMKDNLINRYGIDSNIIEIYEPFIDDKKTNSNQIKIKLKKGPIKIITGWSDRGGSTNAFIALTNALNNLGYDTTLYGPHNWHLDKCKSGLLTNNNPIINDNDRLIVHFINLPNRPNAGKVILSCHEKNLFKVGKINQFWDEAVFLNQRHKDYHNEYYGKYTIIPNLREKFILRDKKGLEKIAGIIGSFDENKQTHISIQRALNDGCEKVYLFSEPYGPYYEEYVKPLINDKVILKGFCEDKQAMYDMIGCVYHSSKSEVACLVKDECESTGVIFYGNEATDNPPVTITNDEILKQWLKLLEL
jgi:hypothetical protein